MDESRTVLSGTVLDVGDERGSRPLAPPRVCKAGNAALARLTEPVPR